MSLHKEIHLEFEIAEYLGGHGWLYADQDAANYDRARAFYPADLIAWVQETQPQAWETMVKNHGEQAGEVLLTRVREGLFECRGVQSAPPTDASRKLPESCWPAVRGSRR